MKKKTVITTEVEELANMDFFFFTDDDNVGFMCDDESIENAIKEYGKEFPNKLLNDIHRAFNYMATEIADRVSTDMKDLWDRLDELEKKTNPHI